MDLKCSSTVNQTNLKVTVRQLLINHIKFKEIRSIVCKVTVLFKMKYGSVHGSMGTSAWDKTHIRDVVSKANDLPFLVN